MKLNIRPEYENVYGYTVDKWIANNKVDGLTTHYLFSNDAELLAKTTRQGSIYVDGMHKPNRLFITINSGLLDVKGKKVKLYGAVDDNFNTIIPVEYNELKSKDHGFAIARKNNFWGAYSPDGQLIIPIEFNEIIHDPLNRRFFAVRNSVYHFIDYKGRIVKDLNFTSIYPLQINGQTFIKTFIAASKLVEEDNKDTQLVRGKWGLLNADCSELIPAKYDLSYNGPNYALVMSGDLAIDLSTKKWPGMDEYYFGTGGKWGVSDFSDNVLIPTEYDWIDFTENKALFFANNGGTMFYLKTTNRKGFWGIQAGKWGIINNKNEVVVPLEYDYKAFQDTKVMLQKSNKSHFDINLPFEVFDIKGYSG